MSTRPESTDRPWHACEAGEAVQRLGSNALRGLGADQVRERQAEHGPNALPEAPPRPLWRTLAHQFKSPLIYILFVAALLAVALGHHGDAAVILAVVVVNALIGTFQEGRAERSMAALRRLAALHVRVVRDGHEAQLEARELVPGDLLLLAAGDAVGADARLVELAQLQVAEAALTGESVPVVKALAALPEATGLADRQNMAYSGTLVVYGQATGVVVATGAATELGKINEMLTGIQSLTTPLLRQIDRFGRVLALAILGMSAATFVLGTLWRDHAPAEMFMMVVALAASAIPEGLPAIMTVTLALGVQRMAKRHAIVRKLAAVETLGSASVICSAPVA